MEVLLKPAVIWINTLLWNHILVYLLLGVGAYFTIIMGFIQLRALPHSFKILSKSGHSSKDGITAFQAFATGLAGRVGSGNIVGVAVALSAGGPGAIFWMWVTALLGMASAFVEATLAQIFKTPHPKGKYFRGGPAYYIRIGLKSPLFGTVFAICLITAFGLFFNAAQANFITDAFSHAFAWRKDIVAIGLLLVTAPLIFSGVRGVMRFAQLIVPLMAIAYLGLTGYIIILNFADIPQVLTLIVKSAFGLEQAAGGFVAYAIKDALNTGIRRGLYSNEAGMGSAPNAAAAATTEHPVNQGLLQMLGVFIDTLVICSATAIMILLSGAYTPGAGMEGAALTQRAVASQIGPIGSGALAIIVFFFSFSTIIGNYAFTEGNVSYLSRRPSVMLLFRLCFLSMLIFGSLASMGLVIEVADISMALMALVNLIAIALLGKYARKAWADYQRQKKQGIETPIFKRDTIPELAKTLPDNVW